MTNRFMGDKWSKNVQHNLFTKLCFLDANFSLFIADNILIQGKLGCEIKSQGLYAT